VEEEVEEEEEEKKNSSDIRRQIDTRKTGEKRSFVS